MNTLLHPDYFDGIPVFGNEIKKRFEDIEADTQPSNREKEGITVAIRTLNEAGKLEDLLQDIERQELNGEVEVVVIDNESSDHTFDVAKKFGAKVFNLPRSEFTYPRSMNMAVEASSHELVFLTVGHARLVSSKSLRAGINAIYSEESTVSGAFGHALPGSNASRTENTIAMGSLYFTRRRKIEKTGIGTMAATGSLLRKSVWHEVGRFDERYERGGEDGQLAIKMLEKGYIIKDEPLLSTHHTHGLNFTDTTKQWIEWAKLGKPSTLNKDRLKKRRPDMNFDN